MYKTYGKRLIDILLAVTLILLFLPVWLLLPPLLWAIHGRPILFRQQRPGLHGRPFWLYKFRTMANRYDADGQLLPDDQRLSAFGTFLRSSSLDELPELFNILKGEMSFVGPRPLLMEYLPLYSPEQMGRHHLRPGLTGWAQINGRNAISWEEKFAHDLWYVNHISFFLDIKIILLTPISILRRQGITRHGHATTPPFTGNNF